MATIVTKNSSTASAVPTTSDLVRGELAVNVTDKRLFTENASTQIVELGTNPSTVTTTTATVSGTLTANGTFASSNAVVTGGSVNSTPIGATTPSTVRGTTVTATTGFVGGLTGNVVGNVTGNVTGNVVGNVTGDLTGNVTASSGTSTVNNLVVNGTVDFTNTRLTDVAEPVASSDAATKNYVDTSIAAVIDGAPAALDTLNELAAALNDDASFHTTVTNSLAGKLPLAGGTMTGQLSLGSNKIVSVADPTLAQDVATKAYVDAADSTGLPLSGGTMSGAIAMGTNKITGLGTPTDAADATTKAYTDSILGSATSAAASAAAASTSESNAATSASNAASSATASSNSANASASSASEAATSYDNFDDRYLGQKASDPTLDNDGDALLIGALYFNTTSDAMKVYTGAAWVAVAPVATSITVSQISDYTGTATELNYTDGVTSNIQTQLDSKAPIASPTFTGTVTADGLSLGDNDKATFGSSNDLEIYHDGSNSYIKDTGTGRLALQSSSDFLVSNTANTQNYIYAQEGGYVRLYHAGSTKLATTATGIDVTGTVTATSFSGDGSALTGVDSLPSQTGNAGEFLTTDGTNPSWTPLSTSPSLEAIASGTLANGDKVIVNADGTVSVAGLSEAYSPNVGTLTQFESGNTSYTAPAFDSNSNKIVIAYQDTSNSEYGTAVVGTVSGTTISFGTPVVFASVGAFFPSSTFDSNSNKIVISYSDETFPRKGRSIVGTVSGTSISFGSPTIFSENQVSFCQSTFDSSSNKVVVFFRDQVNETLSAAVGTVSGTSISFGSVVIVDTVGYGAGFFATTFDSNLNKVVVCFRGQFDLKGYAEVGTVSGASISFGSTATFLASRVDGVGITFDSNSNKVVISYKDYNNSQYGTAIVGTVSGTSISFGSSVVFRSIDISNNPTVPVFDSNLNKIALTYQAGNVQTVVGTVSGTSISFANDIYNPSGANAFINAAFDSNSNKVVITSVITQGRAVVYSMTDQATNLTTENYIGISDGAYSDTATATVQIIGSVDDAQSGLTAGQSYYIQNDGSLGTTADDPSVFAGTAVSATKLIVKG